MSNYYSIKIKPDEPLGLELGAISTKYNIPVAAALRILFTNLKDGISNENKSIASISQLKTEPIQKNSEPKIVIVEEKMIDSEKIITKDMPLIKVKSEDDSSSLKPHINSLKKMFK